MSVIPLKQMDDDELERHYFHMQANVRNEVGDVDFAKKELVAIQKEKDRRKRASK